MKLRSLRAFAAGVGTFGLLVPLAANAAPPPKPNPLFGDGRVSAFYAWNNDIPSKPGTLLRQEPLETVLGLPSAAKQYRILFSSTDGVGGKDPTAESGALFLPRGTPPKGGWPLLVWGHGTFGVADVCAQSWHTRSIRDVLFLDRWLREGFAIVAPDYQGLGTPGFNPAFNNRSNAYSLLDSARAVLPNFPDLANKILLVGQSQGGSAIVAADGYAAAYAPDLHIVGAIGTGIVYAAGRPLKPLHPIDPDAGNKVDPTISWGFFGALSELAVDPTFDPSKIYTPKALPLLDQTRSGCIWDLESDAELLGLTRINAFVQGYKPSQFDQKVGDTGHKFATLKLEAPLFIGAGSEDALAPGAIALAHDAHEAGSIVEIHLYSGKDHAGTVLESLKDSVPFAHRLIDGAPIKPIYEPEGYSG